MKEISWERLTRLSRPAGVVTGTEADTDAEDEAAESAPTLDERRRDPLLRQPLVVFVHTDPDTCEEDCGGACGRYLDAEQQVLENEKVLLGLRAFRRIRMTPEDAAAEVMLEGGGDELPRLVLVDVARGRAVAIHGGNLRASRVFAGLKKLANGFYKERLDKQVKAHQRMLGEHDKLAQKMQALQERIASTSNDRKADALQKDLDELKDEQRDLERAVETLWTLTLKDL